METLEGVLEKLWGNSPVRWINVDILNQNKDDGIGSQILDCRSLGYLDNIFCGPIILYGFRSFQSLLRTEAHYPRLLGSPGVYHIHLPASLQEIQHIFTLAKQFSMEKQEMIEKLQDYALMGDQLSRIESVMAHNHGNFLGSERLLYGSYLNGRISSKEIYTKALNIIEQKQNDFIGDVVKRSEYVLYRQMFRNPKEGNKITHEDIDKQEKLDTPLKGRILYIDDHACLGWGIAVARALFGNNYDFAPAPEPIRVDECRCNEKELDEINSHIFTERYYRHDYRDSFIVSLSINNEEVKQYENNFFDSLKMLLTDKYLSNFNIVLLDLRLRWHEDEKTMDDNISGFKILEIIRKENAAIPVIILTASRRAKNLKIILDLGADGYFIKEIKAKDTAEEIKEYHRQFIKLIDFAMSKSYLGVAWRIFESIPLDVKQQHENAFQNFKKAIGFLRKKGSSFEEKTFELNYFAESILNLGKAHEEYKNKKKWPKDNSFDRGNLIVYMRDLCAHPRKIKIEEIEAQIILYAFLRLFSNDNLLFSDYLDKINVANMAEDEAEDKAEVVERILKKAFVTIVDLTGNEEISAMIEREFYITKDDDRMADKIVRRYEDDSLIQLVYLFFLCRLKFFSKRRNWINSDLVMYEYIMRLFFKKPLKKKEIKNEQLQELVNKYSRINNIEK